jgi:Major Facilitator Superfamily
VALVVRNSPRAGKNEASPTNEVRNRGATLAVLLIAVFMTTADNSIVNIGVPAIRRALDASGGELQLVVSGYVLSYGVLLVTGARLGDLIGYRHVFLTGLSCFTIASLACGLAPSVSALIGARIVQGAGAAMMVPQVLSAVQLHFAGRDRVRALGLYSAALAAGAAAGQALGGLLISANVLGTWRPIFLINVPTGIVLLAIGFRRLPRDSGAWRGRRLDLAGVATLSAAIILLALPLMIGREAGWPAWTWISLAMTAPALAVFAFVERRVRRTGGDPLLNLDLLLRHPVGWGLLAQAAATTTYAGLLFTLAIYLQNGLGRTPLYSGLVLLTWVAGFGLAGILIRRMPPHPHLSSFGFLLLTLSYVGISGAGAIGATDGALLVVLLGTGGLGMGVGFTALIARLSDAVPPGNEADLSGGITTTSELAGVFGVAIFGSVYLSLTGTPVHAIAIVAIGFAVAALLAAAAAYRTTEQQRSQPTCAAPNS